VLDSDHLYNAEYALLADAVDPARDALRTAVLARRYQWARPVGS
jgi:hypothetical protein